MHVYYDGDCPFCSRYVQWLRLQEAAGVVEMTDLRSVPALRAHMLSKGFDPDQGMAIEIEGLLYVGSDALSRLALLSTRSDTFNRLNHYIFRYRHLSASLYPLLRAGRNATLLLLGRTGLTAETATERAPLTLFNVVLGLFAILHVYVYAFQYLAEIHLSTILIAIFGVTLLLKPDSIRIFTGLFLSFLIDAWLQMPASSNHTIIKNFLLLSMLSAGILTAWKGQRSADFYRAFAPCGRVLLICMYFFGVLHKINSGFLDPSVSCAVALWQKMPAPLNAVNTPAMHYLAIYGTLIFESMILLFLLLRSTRLLGIGLGIGFHALLALSGYAMYAPFSTLAVALHILFIERESAMLILSSPFWQRLHKHTHSKLGYLLLIVWLVTIGVLGWNGSYSQASIVWLPAIVTLAWAVLVYGRGDRSHTGIMKLLWSRHAAVNLLSAAFVLNCLSPYLGLKTAQSMNMFANLQLEGGISNHLIFDDSPGPFHYLNDIVTVTESSGSEYLQYIRNNRLQLTWYGILDHLERNPHVSASFVHRGEAYSYQNASLLKNEIESELHPRWMRNWFHFSPVDPKVPKPCALDR